MGRGGAGAGSPLICRSHINTPLILKPQQTATPRPFLLHPIPAQPRPPPRPDPPDPFPRTATPRHSTSVDQRATCQPGRGAPQPDKPVVPHTCPVKSTPGIRRQANSHCQGLPDT